MADWGFAPTILIFADSPKALSEASAAAAAAGGRVAGCLPVERATERLDRQISVDLVILDVTADHGPMLDQLLDRIEEGAASGRFVAVVRIASELIDIAAARIEHDAVSLLADHDGDALELAVAERLRHNEPQLRDKGEDEDGERVLAMLDEIIRFGRGLAPPGDEDEEPSADQPLRDIDEIEAIEAAVIRDVIRARRVREELFGSGLFADPAWDILLDLTAARIEGRSVAVSSLCIAAAVPATTALRWIKQLTDAGLLRRVADPDDGRRIFIELTDDAARKMLAYFANSARISRA